MVASARLHSYNVPNRHQWYRIVRAVPEWSKRCKFTARAPTRWRSTACTVNCAVSRPMTLPLRQCDTLLFISFPLSLPFDRTVQGKGSTSMCEFARDWWNHPNVHPTALQTASTPLMRASLRDYSESFAVLSKHKFPIKDMEHGGTMSNRMLFCIVFAAVTRKSPCASPLHATVSWNTHHLVQWRLASVLPACIKKPRAAPRASTLTQRQMLVNWRKTHAVHLSNSTRHTRKPVTQPETMSCAQSSSAQLGRGLTSRSNRICAMCDVPT